MSVEAAAQAVCQEGSSQPESGPRRTLQQARRTFRRGTCYIKREVCATRSSGASLLTAVMEVVVYNAEPTPSRMRAAEAFRS